jgi:beta-phosphoglucomutase
MRTAWYIREMGHFRDSESVPRLDSLRALIFDLDGVLIDTEPLHKKAKHMAFAEFGLAVPEPLYDAFRGRSDQDMAEAMARTYGAAGLAWQSVVARKHAIFEVLEHEIEAVPGAIDFVRAARTRFGNLALCTSATEWNQRYAFDRFDLAPCFDVVVHAGMLTRTKPDPEPYRVTVEKLGLPAEACLVIEDSRNGILSAKGAGCRVAGITTSFTQTELEGADLVVDSFAELAQIFKM